MDYTLKSEQFLATTARFFNRLFIPTRKNNYRPQFLQSKVLVWVVLCIVAVKIVAIAVHFPFPSNIFFADVTKTHLVQMLNNDRQARGLSTLVPNEQLDQAALLKAKDMVAKGYFAHYSPEGTTPWFWFGQAGYKYVYAGENLAVGFADSEVVYQAWKDSPTHEANLFQPKYTEVGTAVLQGFGGNDSIVVVQLFGTPKATAVAVSPKPQPQAPAPAPVPQENQPVQEEIAKEPQSNQRVLSGSTGYAISKDSGTANNNFYVRLLNFLVYNDEKLVQYGIYALLIIIGVALLLNIMVNIHVQHKGLIARSLVLMSVLVVSASVTTNLVGSIFPHYISI